MSSEEGVYNPDMFLRAELPILTSVAAEMVKYRHAAPKLPGDRLVQFAWGSQDGASNHAAEETPS